VFGSSDKFRHYHVGASAHPACHLHSRQCPACHSQFITQHIHFVTEPFGRRSINRYFYSSYRKGRRSPARPILPTIRHEIDFRYTNGLAIGSCMADTSHISIAHKRSHRCMLAPYTFVRERFFPFGSQQVSLSGEKRFVFLFIIHRLHPLHLSPDRLPSPLKRLILFQFQTFFHPIVCPFQSLISNSVNGKRFKSACFPADVQCVPTINTHSLERTIGKSNGPGGQEFDISGFCKHQHLHQQTRKAQYRI